MFNVRALSVLVVVGSTISAASATDVPGLRYVDRYSLPYTSGLNGTVFDGTLFGGISGLDYDPSTNSYYGISDDRSQNAPPGGNPAARFYNLSISVNENGFVGPTPVTINSVTRMLRPDGTTFPSLGVDPESIRRNPDGTFFWTSEGSVSAAGNPPLQNPFVRQMNSDGTFVREFANAPQVNPDAVGAGQTRGIRNNLAYESFTTTPSGTTSYIATESSLFQDGPRATASAGSTNRIIRYDTATGNPTAQFVYVTDAIQAANPINANDNGVVEMLALDESTLLVMERSFALNEGNSIRLYKVTLGGATDVSSLDSLVGQSYTPVSKQLLLTLAQPALGGLFNPDNVEGLTFGPVLPDGNQSFLLAVDNNFFGSQANQFILIAVPAPGMGVLLGLAGLSASRRRR
jgi:hypothetical protein